MLTGCEACKWYIPHLLMFVFLVTLYCPIVRM
jgi:hypothetical protein